MPKDYDALGCKYVVLACLWTVALVVVELIWG